MKSGIKTTEFWAFLAGLGVVLYGYFQPKCNLGIEDAVVVMTLVTGYIGGRSWVKAKALQAKKK